MEQWFECWSIHAEPELGHGHCEQQCGVPIGNLTSQLFANVYLNAFDHFVKRELHERYYIRYMDDFIILGSDKEHLRETKERIRDFLWEALNLELHPKKSELFPAACGIDFLGYVLRCGRRQLRRSTVRRFKKKKRRLAALAIQGKLPEGYLGNVLASWRGYASFVHERAY